MRIPILQRQGGPAAGMRYAFLAQPLSGEDIGTIRVWPVLGNDGLCPSDVRTSDLTCESFCAVEDDLCPHSEFVDRIRAWESSPSERERLAVLGMLTLSGTPEIGLAARVPFPPSGQRPLPAPFARTYWARRANRVSTTLVFVEILLTSRIGVRAVLTSGGGAATPPTVPFAPDHLPRAYAVDLTTDRCSSCGSDACSTRRDLDDLRKDGLPLFELLAGPNAPPGVIALESDGGPEVRAVWARPFDTEFRHSIALRVGLQRSPAGDRTYVSIVRQGDDAQPAWSAPWTGTCQWCPEPGRCVHAALAAKLPAR